MRYDKKTRSPYHKYGKKPFQYSASYDHWASAVRTHGLMSDEAFEADKAFRRVWHIPPRPAFKRGFGESFAAS